MTRLWPITFACLCGMLLFATGDNRFARGEAAANKTYSPEELKNLDVGPTCITADCHTPMKQLRFRHGPTAEGKCEPCHQSVGGKHVFTSVAKGNALCLECHDPLPAHKVAHKPVRENCLECHNIHGENNRFFVRGGEGAAVCNRCHDDVGKGLKFLHGPFAQGLCLACHEPHESDNPKLLNTSKEGLCATCHEDLAEEDKKALFHHEPFQKDCSGCHSGHGSGRRYFLLAAEDELCNKCHKEVIEAARNAKFPHEPVKKGQDCSKCHSSHFSDSAKLLKQASMPLCLDCHNRTYDKPDGKHLSNIQTQLANSKYLHGPIRDGSCTPCHNAHGSDNFGMLTRYFPPRFYAPFSESNYDLCFFCHDKKPVLAPQSENTKFRNGLQNLHYLHVNREKGRTCRACHAEHASNNPVHMRNSVPYGRWTMEIDYEKTATGGTCLTGCHSRYGYDRIQPVQNITTGTITNVVAQK